MKDRSKPARLAAGAAMCVALLVAIAAVLPASAEQLPILYPKFEVAGSLTSIVLNTNIRIDSEQLGTGTDFDAEDDLGLEEVAFQPRGALRWRPGRKHEIEGGFQFAQRNSEKSLERDITVGDTTFAVGAAVRTTLNTNEAFLNYRFALFANERNQAGFGLGLGTIFLGTEIEALASAGSNQVDYESASSIILPYGSLGIYGRILSGERWYFEGDFRALHGSVDRFTVNVWDVNGAARYYLSKKVGLEAGYGVSAIKVDIAEKTFDSGRKGLFSGQVKYSLQNIRLGAVYTF